MRSWSSAYLDRVRTKTQQIEAQLITGRLIARLSIFFGLLALPLSCIGLYGLLACEVARRTREIGIRMALEAHSGDVFRLVIEQAVALTLAGAVMGIGAALGVTRFLNSLLYGVKAADPLTFTVHGSLKEEAEYRNRQETCASIAGSRSTIAIVFIAESEIVPRARHS